MQATANSRMTETICQGLTNIHELWAVPIELGIALWLLEKQLGLAFLAPGAVAIFAVRFRGIHFSFPIVRSINSYHLPRAALTYNHSDGRHCNDGKVYGQCSEGLD